MTEVIEKVNSKKSGRKNHRLRRLNKNIAGRIPETTRIVVQNNLFPNLDKVKISRSRKILEITKIADQYNIKSVKIFSVQGCG